MNILKSAKAENKQEALEVVNERKSPMARMCVNITRKSYKEIKQRALDEDITVTELIHKAVKEYMNK